MRHCDNDGTALLNNLGSLFRVPVVPPLNPSPSHCTVGSRAAEHAIEMEVFSVANFSGLMARQHLCGVNCNA